VTHDTSPARPLFDDLVAGGAAKVEEWVRRSRGEDLHLDYKRPPRESNPDKRRRWLMETLGEAISGYAYGEGGLIVWGVDKIGRTRSGVESSHIPAPIGALAEFVAELRTLTTRAASPAPAGVRHEALPIAGDRGYAVTYVPASEEGVMDNALHCYHRRSGESFGVLEHYEVVHLLRRTARPRVELAVEMLPAGSSSAPGGGIRRGVDVVFGVSNVGGSLARYPALRIRFLRQWHVLASQNLLRFSEHPHPLQREHVRDVGPEPWQAFVGGADVVVYPRTTAHAFALHYTVPEDASDEEVPDLPYEYSVYADGASDSGTGVVRLVDLLAVPPR
jgi:hypothetical protein